MRYIKTLKIQDLEKLQSVSGCRLLHTIGNNAHFWSPSFSKLNLQYPYLRDDPTLPLHGDFTVIWWCWLQWISKTQPSKQCDSGVRATRKHNIPSKQIKTLYQLEHKENISIQTRKHYTNPSKMKHSSLNKNKTTSIHAKKLTLQCISI